MLALIQPSELTPYLTILLALLIGVIGYLVRQSIGQGNRLVAIETALKYFFDTTGKGAAIVLDTPNPTPPEMSELLKKHRNGTLTNDERAVLAEWLRQVIADPHEAGKRGAALSLLGALGGMERLNA